MHLGKPVLNFQHNKSNVLFREIARLMARNSLLNELGKIDKMRGLPSILSLFRNNTGGKPRNYQEIVLT